MLGTFEMGVDLLLCLVICIVYAVTLLLVSLVFAATTTFLLRQYKRGVVPLKLT